MNRFLGLSPEHRLDFGRRFGWILLEAELHVAKRGLLVMGECRFRDWEFTALVRGFGEVPGGKGEVIDSDKYRTQSISACFASCKA